MSNPESEDVELEWRQSREARAHLVAALEDQGICYICHDLATGEIFGQQPCIYEDARFKAVLAVDPRMYGHTIVILKPHRPDISALNDEQTASLFQLSVKIVNAMKTALGAEKVYLNTMCDGEISHLHLQLFPRFPGDSIGSKRFVAPRTPLLDGESTAYRIGQALRPKMRP